MTTGVRMILSRHDSVAIGAISRAVKQNEPARLGGYRMPREQEHEQEHEHEHEHEHERE